MYAGRAEQARRASRLPDLIIKLLPQIIDEEIIRGLTLASWVRRWRKTMIYLRRLVVDATPLV